MAHEAQRLTRWFFGRTIGLYVPIYLSNVCSADCTYCGYAIRSGNREKRDTLKETDIHRECETLARQGFQNVLLLTGEARHAAPVDYIARAVEIAREYFPSVSIEVYSMDEEEYARLVDCGLEGMTCYMETYDREVYSQVHLIGEKADYKYRIGASERAGRAGVRRLSIGVLLGLSDWRVDAFRLIQHAHYLQRVCWQSALSISFPRLRHTPERFEITNFVSDRELVQMMLATRLLLPEAGFNISTREPKEFRDRLIPLGTTMMSAGSSTRPGGYATTGEETLEQFELEDHRPLEDVIAAIRAAGYDPVLKDFDRAFDEEPEQRLRAGASH
jgi:2-iminoacetate synthase